MKKMLFPALAALLLIAGACTQKNEYANALPSDVEMIISTCPATLADKAGVNDKENEAVLQKLKDYLKTTMPASTFEYVGNILDHPSETGIDLQSPWYFFTSKSLPTGAVVAHVSDESNLQTLLEQIEQAGTPMKTEAGENHTLVQTNDGLLLAYNASTLFIAGQHTGPQTQALKDSLNNWMQQDISHSFSAMPVFQKMEKQSGDIKGVYPSSSLPLNRLTHTGHKLTKELNLQDLQMIASLSFEKGSINLNLIPYTENEQTQKLLEQCAQAVRPIQNTFIDYFPQSTLCLFSSGIDGAAYYDILMANTPFGEQLSAKDAEYIKKLFGIFQDDFTLGLVNMNLNGKLSVLAYATVKDAAPLKELADNTSLQKQLGRGTSILKLDADQYVLRDGRSNLFFGVRDGKFYATNDETLYKDILKKCTPSASETSYASDMKGKKSSCVFNAEAISQLPIVKMLIALGSTRYASLFAFLDNISYLKSESDGKTVSVILQLKDRDSNALKQLAELGKTALL